MFNFRFSLSNKIFTLLFGGAIFASLATWYVSSVSLRAMMESQSKERYVTLFTEEMREVESSMAQFQTEMDIFSRMHLIINTLLFSDANTLAIANNRLDDLLGHSAPWDSFIVLDIDGNVVTSTDSISKNRGLSLSPEEHDALAALILQGSVHTDVFSVGNNQTMSFLHTLSDVKDGREQVLGYLVGRISWGSVEGFLARYNTVISLRAKDGSLIAANKFIPKGYLSVLPKLQSTQISPKLNIDTRGKRSAQSEFVTINQHNFLEVLIPEEDVSGYKGNDWIFFALADMDDFINTTNSFILKISAIVGGIIFLLATVVVLVLHRIVTRPIKKIIIATEAISLGDYDQRVSFAANDELGDLARSFDAMATQLSEGRTILSAEEKGKIEISDKEPSDQGYFPSS